MKSKVFALMFVMLALGLALVSCDDGTTGGGGGTVAFVTGHYYLNGDFTSGYVARFYDDAPYFNFEKQWPNGGHSGTYSVSGRIITLKIVNSTSQAQLGQTEYWTVVDSYTIRDPDGNPWILHPDNTTSNPGGNNTGGSSQGSADNTNRPPDGTTDGGGGGTVAFVTGFYYLNGNFTSSRPVIVFYDDDNKNFEKLLPNSGHSGTYSVSGRIITFKIVNSTSQAQLGQTEYWTIVDSYTIRDPDGNPWIRPPDNTTSNPGGNNTGGSSQGSTDDTNRPPDGTANRPFEVYDVATLRKVGTGTGTGAWTRSAHYKQTADIDLSGAGFLISIGYPGSFSGSYDGGNYTISNLSGADGLFASIGREGSVSNLGLINVNIIGVAGDTGVGGALAVGNQGTVQNCYATGIVKGWQSVGGLVGINSGTISNSYATVSVLINGGGGGGLVGWNSGVISDSHASGDVSTTASRSTAEGIVGALVGINEGTISNSYGTGSVSFDFEDYSYWR